MRCERCYKRTRPFPSGLVSLCLMLLLAGCASTAAVVPDVPPASLMQDCAAPALPSGQLTNLDLVNSLLDHQDALAACNDDKARLRALYPTAAAPSGARPGLAP